MKKRKRKQANKKLITHSLGTKHFVERIECTIRFINAGTAWLFPTTDDPDEPSVASHIAFARIDEEGKVTIL